LDIIYVKYISILIFSHYYININQVSIGFNNFFFLGTVHVCYNNYKKKTLGFNCALVETNVQSIETINSNV